MERAKAGERLRYLFGYALAERPLGECVDRLNGKALAERGVLRIQT